MEITFRRTSGLLFCAHKMNRVGRPCEIPDYNDCNACYHFWTCFVQLLSLTPHAAQKNVSAELMIFSGRKDTFLPAVPRG